MIMFSFFSFKKKSSRYSKKVNDSCTCGDNTKATRCLNVLEIKNITLR